MAIQLLNLGAEPTPTTLGGEGGDNYREAHTKINANFNYVDDKLTAINTELNDKQTAINALLTYTNSLEDRLYQLTPFTSYHLFRDSTVSGVWYDPSDKSTLFQDAARTIPVTKSGDPVRVMLDKSGNGNHAIAPSSAARPIYRTDGILHWLEPDGVDDYFDSISLVPYVGGDFFISTAMAITGGQSSGGLWRFLREGGSATAASDNYLESYSFSPYTAKRVFQRYPSSIIFYDNSSARPASSTNHISWLSNNAIGAKTQVMPTQPNPIDLGVKNLASGNATLSLFRGYGGQFMKGRFYGFVWVSGDVEPVARDKANAYLAAKAGVTI
ncbi:hypothetical protein ACI2I3_00805 [Psychrobacter namhaensis]|uniref:Tail fiber protein n=1 Tax=Psychrobacter namhaensis TaxID=292734 RepID=A0ABW8L7L9_9GAMM